MGLLQAPFNITPPIQSLFNAKSLSLPPSTGRFSSKRTYGNDQYLGTTIRKKNKSCNKIIIKSHQAPNKKK